MCANLLLVSCSGLVILLCSQRTSASSSAAMYRPSFVKNKELMTLFEGDGEESFYQNEDSASEVRLKPN